MNITMVTMTNRCWQTMQLDLIVVQSKGQIDIRTFIWKAIDINPFQNPWVLKNKIEPPTAKAYADRSKTEPGMLYPKHPLVQAFESIGWTWGGNWKRTKDYQHFSLSGR